MKNNIKGEELEQVQSVLPLPMFSEKFLMSDVLAEDLMLSGLLFLFFTFLLLLG